MSLSFEKLPEAVSILTREFQELKQAVLKRGVQEVKSNTKPFLNVKETADYLNLAVPTIYSKVSRGELPFIKRGKKLYFSSSDLEDYLNQGRREFEVVNLLKRKGGKQ